MFDLYLALIFISSELRALCPPANTQISAQVAAMSYLLDVNVYGEADRKSASEFAKGEKGATGASIENRYAASGDFSCGSFLGQGEIVIKNDVVVTSLHNYYDDSKCPNGTAPPLSSCKFTTNVGGKKVDYALDKILASGFKCDDDDKGFNVREDWIVFKLSTPTDPKIKPYQLPSDPEAIANQSDLVQVAKSKDFNPKKVRTLLEVPKHFGRCSKQSFNQVQRSFETDCDSDGGSSGGAVLSPGESPALLGIVKGRYNNPCPEGGVGGKSGPYRKGCWATINTAITGDFYRELDSIRSQSGSARESFGPRGQKPTETPYFKDL